MITTNPKSCIGRFLNRFWYWLMAVIIVALGIYFRFDHLGQIPAGMTWDEAAIGYNGYAVWTTHRDEWLHLLPISFQSFGDYKAPLAIYLNGLFTYLFGLNLLGVRLPFALAGIASLAGLFPLYNQWAKLFNQQPTQYRSYSLLLGFLMAFSPWHLHYSRVGFESGLALMFLIWGVGLLFRLQNNLKKSQTGIFKTKLPLLLASIFLASAVYSYHSAKIVIPALLVVLIFWQRHFWLKHLRQLSAFVITTLLLLIPFLYDTFFLAGATRINTTIFSLNLGLGSLVGKFLGSLLRLLSVQFLLLGETTTLRHGDGKLGVLFLTTFVACLLGLVATFKWWRKKQKTKFWQGWLPILWILIGLSPAALGQEIPHSNRALLALPGFLLLAVTGLEYIMDLLRRRQDLNNYFPGSHGEKNLLMKSVLGGFLFIHLLIFINYWSNYTQIFATQSVDDFKEGYLEAFQYVKDFEKGTNNQPQVEKIVFTDYYGQPYIYALFARHTNPIWYRGGSLNIYDFHSVDIADLQRKNAVVVAAGAEETPITEADKLIIGSDGSVRFKIYVLDDKP